MLPFARLLALVAILAACGDRTTVNEPTSTVAENAASQSQQLGRFVAFREQSIVIDRLEAPVAPPIAVGSTLAADLLYSSAPETVSVDPTGFLIAHRAGTAEIRSPGGGYLRLEVHPVTSIRVLPDRLTMKPGATATVRILGDDGTIDERQITSETTDPAIASLRGNIVSSGLVPGIATLTVKSGGAVATFVVEVLPGRTDLALAIPSKSLTVGSVERIEIRPSAEVAVDWTTTDAAVLKHLRDGVFYAAAPGKVRVCANTAGSRACDEVKVIP
jgi:hypothetical protein